MKVKEKFIIEFRFYREFYQVSFFTVLILGMITSIVCFILSFYFEDFIVQQFNNIAEQTLVNKKGELTNVQKFFAIFPNNLFVGLVIILCGFIPIYGLPVVYSLLSFASVGIVMGFGFIMEKNILQAMMVAFVPHAVIEVIAILYSVAIGMYVNKNMIKKVYFRKKKSEKFKYLLIRSMKSYLLIVIPVFLIAALVEAFITSRLADSFL